MDIWSYASQGDVLGLKTFLSDEERRAISLNSRNWNASTPLICAAEAGALDAVDYLLSLGADVHAVNVDSKSALHKACIAGHAHVARRLLEDGAVVQLADVSGLQSLHYAAWMGRVECVKLCIQMGGDIEARSGQKRTPLDYACSAGHANAAELLISLGAVVDTLDEFGCTPLTRAVERHHLSTVRVLFQNGASTHIRNIYGKDSHAIAKQHGNPAVLELFAAYMEGAELPPTPSSLVSASSSGSSLASSSSSSNSIDATPPAEKCVLLSNLNPSMSAAAPLRRKFDVADDNDERGSNNDDDDDHDDDDDGVKRRKKRAKRARPNVGAALAHKKQRVVKGPSPVPPFHQNMGQGGATVTGSHRLVESANTMRRLEQTVPEMLAGCHSELDALVKNYLRELERCFSLRFDQLRDIVQQRSDAAETNYANMERQFRASCDELRVLKRQLTLLKKTETSLLQRSAPLVGSQAAAESLDDDQLSDYRQRLEQSLTFIYTGQARRQQQPELEVGKEKE
jgi:ankyrin repeat protein